MHSVDRFMAPAMLCLGLAAASGLQLVIQKHSLTKQRLAVIAATMVLLSELLGVAPPPWPVPSTPVGPHPASLALAEEPQQGAVIDLPFRQNGFFVSDIYVQQMTHGRPVPYRNIGRHGEPIHPVVWDTALFQRAVGPLMSGPKPRPSRCEGHRELSAAGFAFIVVRRDRLTQATAQAVEQPLAECLGAPDVYADAAVYRLDPSAASDPALANPRGWRAPPRHGVGGVGHR